MKLNFEFIFGKKKLETLENKSSEKHNKKRLVP